MIIKIAETSWGWSIKVGDQKAINVRTDILYKRQLQGLLYPYDNRTDIYDSVIEYGYYSDSNLTVTVEKT